MENSSQYLLDVHLLGENKATVTGECSLHPYSVTKQMKALVDDNFQLIRVFGDNLNAFSREERDGGIVKEMILGIFKDFLQEVRTVAICEGIIFFHLIRFLSFLKLFKPGTLSMYPHLIPGLLHS